PAPVLARMARPDGPNEVVLVATACDDGSESLVAEARLVYDAEAGRCAEFAIAVTDVEQGRGLGEKLLRGLMRRAGEKGIRCVYGDGPPDNPAGLGLGRRAGFRGGRGRVDPRLGRGERAGALV